MTVLTISPLPSGVVVMAWWCALALLALSAPARPAPRAGNGELFTRKHHLCTVSRPGNGGTRT